MNAALIGRFGRATLVAAGLSLVTAATASAHDRTPEIAYTPIALSGPFALSTAYAGPPTSSVTLGGVPFSVGGGFLVWAGQSQTVATSVEEPTSVHLLLNSADTWWFYAGRKLGDVTLRFSDGTKQTVSLVIGTNIREWKVGAGSLVVSTTTDPATKNVWSGSAVDGYPAVIDMLTVAVPPTDATLTSVTVTNSAVVTDLGIIFSGLTVAVADEDGHHDRGHHAGAKQPEPAEKHAAAGPEAQKQQPEARHGDGGHESEPDSN